MEKKFKAFHGFANAFPALTSGSGLLDLKYGSWATSLITNRSVDGEDHLVESPKKSLSGADWKHLKYKLADVSQNILILKRKVKCKVQAL